MRRNASLPRDATEFTAFYHENYSRVVAYARRRSDLDPETVASSVFTIAWERYEQSMARGLPWLYRAAMFELQNQRRINLRQDRVRSRVVATSKQSETDETSTLVERLWVTDLLSQLPDADRELLELIYWEDLDYKAASFVLSCSAATVAVRAHRARKKFERLAIRSSAKPLNADHHSRCANSEVS